MNIDLIRGGLRMLALGLLWRWASRYEYAEPWKVGYRAAIHLPVVGAVAFLTHDEQTICCW